MFQKYSTFPFPTEEVFEYHSNVGALDRLIPPWEKVRILQRGRSLAVGTEVKIENRLGPLRLNWLARHTVLDPPNHFQDIQLSGPFRSWKHDHRFETTPDSGCRLGDEVTYQLPFEPMGRIGKSWIEKKLHAMFTYRHQTTLQDLTFKKQLFPDRRSRKIRIAVSGSSGLIGRRVCAIASVLGMEVIRVLRPGSKSDNEGVAFHESVTFDQGRFDNPESLQGIDAFLQLGGHSVAQGRWTEQTKRKILESRVAHTNQLVEALKLLEMPPKTLVCASAIGWYGDRGSEVCYESDDANSAVHSHRDNGKQLFLQKVCRSWESAAAGFASHGSVRIGRLGMVLHPQEGALSKMLPIFGWGLGGVVGSGQQYWSWIHIDDAASALLAIGLSSMTNNATNMSQTDGPQSSSPSSVERFNLVAPETLTNREFTKTLGSVLNRPTVLPAPAWGLRIALGDMADELLLASVRAESGKLSRIGYSFRFPTLRSALNGLLGR